MIGISYVVPHGAENTENLTMQILNFGGSYTTVLHDQGHYTFQTTR